MGLQMQIHCNFSTGQSSDLRIPIGANAQQSFWKLSPVLGSFLQASQDLKARTNPASQIFHQISRKGITGSFKYQGMENAFATVKQLLHSVERFQAASLVNLRRKQIVLTLIQGGLDANLHPDGSSEGVRRSVENCLKILDGKKKIDIFEYARVDKRVPIEETLKSLKEYVKAGKIGGIGLSEVSAATIEKAAKVTRIAGVEIELSLFSTQILENGVAEACAKHQIPIIA
jgi:hypothetical protein